MSDPIRFLLKDELREVRGLPPTMTVLEYLRTVERKCGTKEGCAEGDCGACTVVVVTLDDNGELSYRPVNACIQFLPTLDGQQLLTVEHLKDVEGRLHPVQQAMVDLHASQCGFCTPGFVMSLYALWRNNRAPTRDDIATALSGNLCRCTGYRPILDAAVKMYDGPAHDRFDSLADNTAQQLRGLRRPQGLSYIANSAEFYAPQSLAELQRLLHRYPAAPLLAGGTDFGLWVTKQHRTFERIIYLGRVRELAAVKAVDGRLEIGGGATWEEAHAALARLHPDLGELVVRFASPPIRNAATVGGNIANASPIGDGPPPLIALGATVELVGPTGVRALPLERFFVDYRRTALAEGEIVARVIVPRPPADLRFAVYKIAKRYDQDISAVCAAFAVRLAQDSRVSEARLAFGGLAATPRRATTAEAALVGRPWTPATIERARAALASDFTPITDMRASRDYRLKVAGNLLHRFHHETSGAAGESRVFAHG